MGDAPQPVPERPDIGGYQASSLLVGSRPDEMAFALREEEFRILCEGEVSASRSNRDVCIGIAFTALVGLIGVLSIVDWASAWNAGHRGWLFWLGILLISLSGATMGALVHHMRLRNVSDNSAYSRLRQRITDWFGAQRIQGEQAVNERGLVVLSARYGANQRWLDVTPVLSAKIRDGKLRVPVTNNEFGNDPVPNVSKALELEYSHRGRAHRKVVPEGQELQIPEI
jgi:hypothetical protein